MAVEIKSGASSDVASVDANKQLAVVTSSDMGKAGYTALACRNDEGAFRGTSYNTNLEGDDDYRLRVAVDSIFFSESWAGAALNSAQWSAPVTTMAVAVNDSWCKLNSGGNAAVNTVARITSYATIPVDPEFPLFLRFPLQVVAAAVGLSNNTWEVGLGFATGTAAPTDGVFLRMNALGELRLVASYNGTEIESGVIDYSTGVDPLLPINVTRQTILTVSGSHVELWMDDVLIAKLEHPASSPFFTRTTALPIFARIYNGAIAPPSATQLWIGPITVSRSGQVNAPLHSHIRAMMGQHSVQGQSGGTMGQTANWTNSTEPVNATLSNTAAGYTTLGGQWSFAAPAGAVTDFALFAYQVPVAAAGNFSKGLLITRVRIDAVNAGAAVATTATILQWGIATGSTAVSLATTESATGKAPRRLPLGIQSFVVGDPIGARVEAVDLSFEESPLPVNPGEFVHIIVRVPVGTATASQVIRGTCTIIGHYV
jgi:hypothetical protein